MEDRLRKTERLIRLWMILVENPFRYTAKTLADRLSVNIRTVYRDLESLDLDLRLPVRKESHNWGIDDRHFLPPVRFSTPEALSIFLSARLLLSYSHRYDPNVDATFVKLATRLPAPLDKQVQDTIDWMRHLPKNEKHLAIMGRLAEAWVTRRRVKIVYRKLGTKEGTERVVDPYFIEPAAEAHADYLIAFCHQTQEVRTFKIERIERVLVTDEAYTIDPGFDANRYFGSAWGITVEGEVKTLRIKAAPDIAGLMAETIWHPSQQVEKHDDGSIIMTFQTFDTQELYSWVLKWGEKVEVLEPEYLREAVIATARAILDTYKEGK